jgi:nucleoside-diphosphate-sugar epimerase
VTVALSGATSMLGKRVAKRFSARGRVVSIGRRDDADILIDLRELRAPAATEIRADVMIHCAATFLGTGLDNFVENEIVNAVGCLRITQLAAAMKCRQFIYLSTVSALPENCSGNSYGLSKRHGEENLEIACKEVGIGLTILRITQLYDEAGEARKHQPMLYRIMDSACLDQPFHLFGDSNPVRNFLFVEDLVGVIEGVVDYRVTGAHSVVHPLSYPLSEIVAMAFESFGRTPQIIRCPHKPSIPAVWYPRDTALYDMIHYWPKVDLRKGVDMIRDRMR